MAKEFPENATVTLNINDEAIQEILGAIQGTGQNQIFLFEMIMNTTIALLRVIDVLKSVPTVTYNEAVHKTLESIDLGVLNAQVQMCNEALKSWQEMHSAENTDELLDGKI